MSLPRVLLVAFSVVAAPLAVAAPEKWTDAITKFTETDQAHPPAKGGIVFVGSSSIVKWTTLEKDFAGLPVLNRGFGGSELSDSVFYADKIVTSYQPRIVVVYAGENDINAGKTPEKLHSDFNAFRHKVHAAVPGARIIFISMKPSPSRWKLRENFVRANQLIADECKKDKRLTYLDVWTPMLDAKGEPRPELFVADMLHMNDKGYAIWTPLLRPLLK